MTRQTDYHNWPVPEEGSEEWDEPLDTTIDEIDYATPTREEDEPAVEGTPAGDAVDVRIRLDVSGEMPADWPVISYDDGTEIAQVETAQRWDRVPWAWRDRDDTVYETWTFEDEDGDFLEIDADITGNADTAREADEADEALNAHGLGGKEPEAYAVRTAEREITEEWRHEAPITASAGLDCTGPLSLPVFSSLDEEPRRGGADDDDDDDDDTSEFGTSEFGTSEFGD